MGVENIQLAGTGEFIDSAANYGIATEGIFSANSFNSGTILTTASFSDTTTNNGTVLSAASFQGGATNNGFLSSVALFDGTSINNGAVAVSASFVGQSNNSGTVYGTATFGANSVNDNTGSVGEAFFVGSAVNAGSATSASFAETAINNGAIAVSAVFADSASNGFGGTVPSAIFNGFASNNGIITVEATFNDSSANQQLGIVPVAIFTGTAVNAGSATAASFSGSASNTGVVSLSASFTDTASNSGVTYTATFAGSAANSGSVVEQAIFTDTAINTPTGSTQGVVVFDGNSVNTGTVAQAIFLGTSSNTGVVTLSATFSGSSSNTGDVQGNAVFVEGSTNTGTISGNAAFETLSANNGSVGGEVQKYVPVWLSDSTNNHTTSVSGTVTQYIEGNGISSVYFDGQAPTFVFATKKNPSIGGFNFGTGDFTVEAWVNPASYGKVIFGNSPSSYDSPNSWNLLLATSGALRWSSNVYGVDGNIVIPPSEWSHIAATRANGTMYFWVNGRLDFELSWPTNLNIDEPLALGYAGAYARPDIDYLQYSGLMSCVRIIGGAALYTPSESTVPITVPSADNSTLLMTFGASAVPLVAWYRDNSSITKQIIMHGSVIPVDEGNGVIVADFNGASTLEIPDADVSFGTNIDFTIEFFVKGTDSGINSLIARRGGFAEGAWQITLNGGANGFGGLATTDGWYGNDHIDVANTVQISDGSWHHVAVTRYGSKLTYFVDGIEVASGNNWDSFDFSAGGGNGVYVGSNIDGSTQLTTGRIAWVRIVKGTAIYTSNFAVPTTPLTNVTGTQLLLNFGATSVPSIIPWYGDNSSLAQSVTKYGTVTKSDEGNGVIAAAFDQSTYPNLNYLKAANVEVGSGDFTVEVFAKQYDLQSVYRILMGNFSGWSQPGLQMLIEAGNHSAISEITNGDGYENRLDFIDSAASIADQWYHYALTRSAGTVHMYVNGYSVAHLDNVNTSFEPSDFAIGTSIESANGGENPNWNGKITGLRIVNGPAVYTSNFIVPTSLPTDIAGTQLLLNFGGTTAPTVNVSWYADTSSALHLMTLYGSISQIDEGNGVKVAYLNHVTDTLNATVQGNEFEFDGDFTIEAFTKNPAGSPDHSLFVTSDNSSYFALNASDVDVNVYLNSTTPSHTASGALTQNTWSHVALVRNGSNITLYVNGIGTLIDGSSSGSLSYATPAFARMGGSGLDGEGYIAGLRVVKGTAVYTSDFTVPTTLPTDISGTQLLLNFGATAAPVVPTTPTTWYSDESTSAHPITLNGGVSQSDEGNGVVAALFDGSAGYLVTNDNIGLGTGSFTVEMFVYKNSGINQFNGDFIAQDQGGFQFAHFELDNSIYYSQGGIVNLFSTPVDISDGWHHVAAVRDGSTIAVYVDGKAVINATDTTDFGSSVVHIGAWPAASQWMSGKITGLRITNTAVYTSNFTVPTSLPTNISGTQLLLNFGGTSVPTLAIPWYYEESANHYTTTVNGNAFPDADGDRRYASFDGDQNSFIATNAPGNFSGDFTMEAFVYFDSSTGYQGFIFGNTSSGTDDAWCFGYRDGQLTMCSGVTPYFGGYIPSGFFNQWHHVAFTRENGSYSIWLNGSIFANPSGAPSFNSSYPIAIGANNANLDEHGNGYYTTAFKGYIDSLRIVDGTALYTGSSYTVPDPLLTNVAGTRLLYNFNSTRGYIPQYQDLSLHNIVVPVGNPVKANGYVTFNGASYLKANSSTNFDFGTQDFTIEFVVNFSSLVGEQSIITTSDPQDWNGIHIETYNNGLYVSMDNDGAGDWALAILIPSVFVRFNWYHITVTRTGGVVYVFKNGILIGTSNSHRIAGDGSLVNIGNSNHRMLIGGRPNYSQLASCSIAYVNVVIGSYLYGSLGSISSFTPPTAPPSQVDANAKLTLTFDNNGFPGLADSGITNSNLYINGALVVENMTDLTSASLLDHCTIPGSPIKIWVQGLNIGDWVWVDEYATTYNGYLMNGTFAYNGHVYYTDSYSKISSIEDCNQYN